MTSCPLISSWKQSTIYTTFACLSPRISSNSRFAMIIYSSSMLLIILAALTSPVSRCRHLTTSLEHPSPSFPSISYSLSNYDENSSWCSETDSSSFCPSSLVMKPWLESSATLLMLRLFARRYFISLMRFLFELRLEIVRGSGVVWSAEESVILWFSRRSHYGP